MADFEAPSFSLGLDLDEPQPDLRGPEPHSSQSQPPGSFTPDEFEAEVPDSDPDVPAPALKRLRRGPGRAQRKEPEKVWCNVDEEIEEFSSQEDLRRDEHPPVQSHSLCSTSKFPLHGHGILSTQSASHRKAGKRGQASNDPASASMETSSSKLVFPKLTVSPLRRFQLLDSDSDDPSICENASVDAKKPNPFAKERWSNPRKYSAASEEKRTKAPASIPQNEDLWKDFCPNMSFSISTPVLDEVCKEYFSSVNNKNVTLGLGGDVCTSNEKSSCHNKNNRKTLVQEWDLGNPLPPAHRFFFHADPRIQKLVRSRLPNFSPLGVVNNTNSQPGASVIDYMCQFSHREASGKQVNQNVNIEGSSTLIRTNARKLNAEEALDASGSWVNPKHSASVPKDAGKRRVHANGQSDARWYTAPDGRRVYVAKSGQQLTGSIAYKHYRKESGRAFKKSKRKSTAKKIAKKKQKT